LLQVDNVGLLLLWPYLPSLLRQWGLVEEGRFVDSQAQQQAACWLHSWLWGEANKEQRSAHLAKILCGWPLSAALEPQLPLSDHIAASLEATLNSLQKQIPSLHRCSTQDMRTWFLLRPGELRRREGYWHLQVQKDHYDILLGDLLPIPMVCLPWLELPIKVDW
jgi:hypothetical protein